MLSDFVIIFEIIIFASRLDFLVVFEVSGFAISFMTYLLHAMSVGVVTRLAGGGSASGTNSGYADGTGTAATFYHPYGVTVDTLGVLFISDYSNHLIRTMSPAGLISCFLFVSYY